MKSWQLIGLRLYMTSFGRFSIGAAMLRKVLVTFLVKGKAGQGYHASSKFFRIQEIED